MEGNFVNVFFNKIKDKLNSNNTKDIYPHACEYSFSNEELNNLSKQNNEKIKNLKKNVLDKKEELPKEEIVIKEVLTEKLEEKELQDESDVIEEEVSNQDSYINLSKEKQEIIMKRWYSIDTIRLDKNIIKGKDILAHNYTITYGDDALTYIYKIRDEYDIIIEYLIGFNNEKKGILNKTIFSNKLETEWQYLSSYIKILEKIRNNIKK